MQSFALPHTCPARLSNTVRRQLLSYALTRQPLPAYRSNMVTHGHPTKVVAAETVLLSTCLQCAITTRRLPLGLYLQLVRRDKVCSSSLFSCRTSAGLESLPGIGTASGGTQVDISARQGWLEKTVFSACQALLTNAGAPIKTGSKASKRVQRANEEFSKV